MTIENNKITFIEEKDYDNLFIPKNVDGIVEEEYAIGFAAITPKTITVEEGNTAFYVQNNCLIERATKTLVVAGERATIPDDGSVEIIADCAFNGNRTLTTEFVIPEGVVEIGQMAFKDTNIEKIIIPASVEVIGALAFWCADKTLKEIVVDKSNSHFYVESNCLIFIDALQLDEDGFMTNNIKIVISIVNRNAREVVIPKDVAYIGRGTFFRTDFERVYLPKNITILPQNFGISEEHGSMSSRDKNFEEFCKEHNLVYGYDKSE